MVEFDMPVMVANHAKMASSVGARKVKLSAVVSSVNI